jgi:hypothetical protein
MRNISICELSKCEGGFWNKTEWEIKKKEGRVYELFINTVKEFALEKINIKEHQNK